MPKRRWVLGLLSIALLFFLYRFFTVYTARSGECKPKPVDTSTRIATRTEQGQLVSFPERSGFPPQQRPLIVMTYNIAGHDELYRSDHIQKIAAVINEERPDIVALEEVHRKTWQSRFRDQLAELEAATHMHGYFAPSYVQWGGGFGNAILTRGDIAFAEAHPLPSLGEPRTVIETVIRIDNVTLNVYATHLVTWGSLNSKTRREQLECLARHVRTSRYPYLLAGDLNAGPDSDEVKAFRKLNAAQLCGEDIGETMPAMGRRIDYIFADYGWEVRNTRVLKKGPSDHWPVVAELMWRRNEN